MGDIMWYLMRICDVLDITLQEVLDYNIAKLTKRLAENSIKGDGDER